MNIEPSTIINYVVITTSIITLIVGLMLSYLVWINQPKKIKFILVNPKASPPERGTAWSAGYDLRSCETCVIPPRSNKAINIGIKVILPANTYGRIASRSGLSFKHGIEVGAGTIDEDYRNLLSVNLWNHSDIEFVVEEKDRIAQLIIQDVLYPITLVKDFCGNTKVHDSCIRSVRGLGGLGSTGIK